MRAKPSKSEIVDKNRSKTVLSVAFASSLFLVLLSANDLIISPYGIVPKLSLTVTLLLALLLSRNHFGLGCIHKMFRVNAVGKNFITISIVYFLLQLVRPVFWSEQPSISKMYWAIQFIELLLLFGILQHSLTCEMQKSSQNFYQSINLVRSFFIALLFYSVILMILSITNYAFRVGLFEFSSRASNWIVLYIMIPTISLAILKGKTLSFTCAFVIIVASVVTIFKINSRSGLVSFAVFISILLLLLFFSSQSFNLRIYRISPFFLGGVLLVSYQFNTVKQLIFDTLVTGQVRKLDTGFTETVDQDRLLHLQTSFDVITRDFFHSIFGYGFRESSYVMAQPLYEAYLEYLPHLDFESELGSRTNVSTFGFSALIVDFGLVGLLLFGALIVRQVFGLPWRIELFWSTMRLVSILLFLLLLYTANLLASPWFAVLVLQGNLIDELYLRLRSGFSRREIN